MIAGADEEGQKSAQNNQNRDNHHNLGQPWDETSSKSVGRNDEPDDADIHEVLMPGVDDIGRMAKHSHGQNHASDEIALHWTRNHISARAK